MTFDLDYYWQKVQNNSDEKAFEQIFNQVSESLCYYSFYLLKDQVLAEEIVQDVFVKLWQTHKDIDVRSNFKAYLFQMVHNFSINKVIQNNTLKNTLTTKVSDEVWNFLLETQEYNAFLIENIEAEDTNKVIIKAIDELPNQCREIFHYSKFKNKTNQEIADILNISVNTVRTQIYRALEKIKAALEKEI